MNKRENGETPENWLAALLAGAGGGGVLFGIIKLLGKLARDKQVQELVAKAAKEKLG